MLHEEEFSESLKKILSAIYRPDACCLIVFKDNHSECDKIKDEKVFFLLKEFSLFFVVVVAVCYRTSANGKENISLWLSAHWGLVPQWGCKLQIRNINTNKQPHLWSIKAFQPLKQRYFCSILPLPNFKGIIKGNCYADRISSRHNQNKQLTWAANFQKGNPAMALLPILFTPQPQKTRHTAAAASRFTVHRWGGQVGALPAAQIIAPRHVIPWQQKEQRISPCVTPLGASCLPFSSLQNWPIFGPTTSSEGVQCWKPKPSSFISFNR